MWKDDKILKQSFSSIIVCEECCSMAPDYTKSNQSSLEHTDIGATMEMKPEPFVAQQLIFFEALM